MRAATAVLSSLIGAATTVWQVGILRAGAWAARGLRVPARNLPARAQLASSVGGRARPEPGRQVLTTLATAVTRNNCPISISRTAKV